MEPKAILINTNTSDRFIKITPKLQERPIDFKFGNDICFAT